MKKIILFIKTRINFLENMEINNSLLSIFLYLKYKNVKLNKKMIRLNRKFIRNRLKLLQINSKMKNIQINNLFLILEK